MTQASLTSVTAPVNPATSATSSGRRASATTTSPAGRWRPAAYAIVAGNPARVIAHRFDAETIERLLAVRWWDWPDERIEALEPYFYAGVEVFLDEAESRFSSSASSPELPTVTSVSGSPILSAAR